jgi:hypothetical protein
MPFDGARRRQRREQGDLEGEIVTPTPPAPGPSLTRRLSRSGSLIVAGLAVEAVSFSWGHPTSFLLFAFVGVALTGLGIVAYLWALARA